MKIGIACDHRGFKLKEYIKDNLSGYDIVDYGTYSEESVDYPDYAFKLCNGIINNEVAYGIAICGSGIGISIACNKVKGIRCARVVDLNDVKYTRNDNNSNVVALSEKIDKDYALQLVKTFIETPSSTEEKHIRRINKISEYEKNDR